jgi:hypothetical protein
LAELLLKKARTNLIFLRKTLAQRKHIRMQLARGQKLKEKLVKGLGFGILFSPKIW